MDLLQGDFSPQGIFRIAATMERGLRSFYLLFAEAAGDRELIGLCSMLAEIETRHLESLKKLASEVGSSIDVSGENETPEVLEGGYNIRAFLEEVKPRIETVPDALGVAIMLEAQALDLYMRFAYETEKDGSKEILYSIAEEEKSHLKSLGRLMDEKVRT
ncbi:MAG: ferritin family protein [Deltaproteobacteria bacterium]|nr:ferritin family protein [Deltaproteobacteria bacterium]